LKTFANANLSLFSDEEGPLNANCLQQNSCSIGEPIQFEIIEQDITLKLVLFQSGNIGLTKYLKYNVMLTNLQPWFISHVD